MINIVSSSRYTIDRKKIRQVVLEYLDSKNWNHNDILNVALVGKNKMKAITVTYKHETETLPVLSFPYNGEKSEDGNIIGEVIICYPLAILLAAERSKKVDEMLIFLIKHGIDNLIK